MAWLWQVSLGHILSRTKPHVIRQRLSFINTSLCIQTHLGNVPQFNKRVEKCVRCTFADQSVSVLGWLSLLCLAVLLLWHYLPLTLLDPLDSVLPFSVLYQMIYSFLHFLLWCPEIQTWVDVLSWVWEGLAVQSRLFFFLLSFDEYFLFQPLLKFFFLHAQCLRFLAWPGRS